ncbi:MAG: universal stress protein [Thermodesulfobacteriota bacterium]|jgi:nucleotide-binding universal stress UspA family protein|nr:MAG: universal stress protein [Thermodesulfobacteriota bacterium]
MISKILMPTDGSPTAKKAVKYAAGLAKQLDATITLLSVIEIDLGAFFAQTVSAADSPTHLIEPMENYLKQTAELYLAEAETILKQNGVQSKKVIRSGHPVEVIIKEAIKSKVDVIVMGSHGKSALKAAMLGSVTFGVIHKDTKIPVLVVRK